MGITPFFRWSILIPVSVIKLSWPDSAVFWSRQWSTSGEVASMSRSQQFTSCSHTPPSFVGNLRNKRQLEISGKVKQGWVGLNSPVTVALKTRRGSLAKRWWSPSVTVGFQQQLPPSRRKTARKSVSAEVCAESDRKQGEERTFDGVGQREIGGEMWRREFNGARLRQTGERWGKYLWRNTWGRSRLETKGEQMKRNGRMEMCSL